MLAHIQPSISDSAGFVVFTRPLSIDSSQNDLVCAPDSQNAEFSGVSGNRGYVFSGYKYGLPIRGKVSQAVGCTDGFWGRG